MGSGRWDSTVWDGYASATIAGKTTAQIFSSTKMKTDYDPRTISVRESRDSVDNPNSTPIFIASDVTGSMGIVAETLMRDGLNTIAKEIYDRKPVTDPHIMIGAVGDAVYDTSPLQVTQFEADIRLADQVKDLYLEYGGGPNRGESYLLPHLFAAEKIRADAWEKRNKKGYLFTIGDEPFLDGVKKDEASKFLGIQLQSDLSAKECVARCQKKFEIFHVVIGSRAKLRHDFAQQMLEWNDLLPQRVIVLDDHTKLAETIVSVIQVNEGANKANVVNSWDQKTSVVVANAMNSLATNAGSRGVQRL